MTRSQHPLHPLIVHVPIGLLVTVPLWDIASLVRGSVFQSVALWTLGAGLAASLPAVATGVLDMRRVAPGTPASESLARHLIFVVSALSVFGVSLALRLVPPAGFLWGAVASGLVGVTLLAFGGFHGAELVYTHRVGLRRSTEQRASLRRVVYGGESPLTQRPPRDTPPASMSAPHVAASRR
jgi:uncharacterized membrane protein